MEGSGSTCDGPAPAPDHVYLFGHESWASWKRAPGALDQRPMQAVQATAESRPPRHQIRWASGIKLGGRGGNLSARRCGLDAPVKMGLASYMGMARSAAAQRFGKGSKQTPRRHPGRHCQQPPKFRHLPPSTAALTPRSGYLPWRHADQVNARRHRQHGHHGRAGVRVPHTLGWAVTQRACQPHLRHS